jgi:parvulin-like peptidyl-prolyl isomerase
VQTRSLATLILLASFLGHSVAEASANAGASRTVAARAGDETATLADLEGALHVFTLTGDKEAIKSATQRKGAAEAVLRPKQLNASGLIKKESLEAQRYIEQQGRSGAMKGWLDLKEAQALAKLNSEPALLEQRARELYLQRQERYRAPPEANVTLILIDSYRRGFEDAARRVTEVSRRIAEHTGDFNALAEELTDDPAIRAKSAVATIDVVPQQADPPLRRVVFEVMKPGEVSGPHATNYGLVFVRLNRIKQGGVTPFEELREKLIDEIRTEVAKKARMDAFALIASQPVELVEPSASTGKAAIKIDSAAAPKSPARK